MSSLSSSCSAPPPTIADYFVIVGLTSHSPPTPISPDEYSEGLNPNLKNIEPITDITVIFPGLGEIVPKGFTCVEETVGGFPANLNSGSIRSPEIYLCYKRGRDKPPLVDIGVMYDGKERLLPDASVVISTPYGRPANVNNSTARILLTYRRAPEAMPPNELVVTDICVIITNKGEKPPHAYCLINKNLNRGAIMGSSVYLCYKKSMNRPPLLQYKPEILFRFPPTDRLGSEFPNSVGMFCLPMCATVENWPENAAEPRPVFSTFVLTVKDGREKIYGTSVTFYEPYSTSCSTLLTQSDLQLLSIPTVNSTPNLHVNKSICILSHYPFFEALRGFLGYLVKRVREGNCADNDINLKVPIERYISHFLYSIPFPSPSRPHIILQLSPSLPSVLISHPHSSPLPKSGASFRSLLLNLGAENCLLVMLLMLTEQKLLVHSLRADVLTSVVEAISVLIFPFTWQCPYIPLCPLALSAMLQAPVPFLIGLDSRFFDLYEPPGDVTCIDLDTSTITISQSQQHLLTTKLLPKKPARVLKSRLENCLDQIYKLNKHKVNKHDSNSSLDIDFGFKKRESTLSTSIQSSFLSFTTSILKSYRSYLTPITTLTPTVTSTDATQLFDFPNFLKSRDKSNHKFYSLFLKTQLFIRFVEERSFGEINSNSNMEGFNYFDECVERVEREEDGEDDNCQLSVDSNDSNNDVFVFITPPEAKESDEEQVYNYNGKFELDEKLFDTIIEGENQSQSHTPIQQHQQHSQHSRRGHSHSHHKQQRKNNQQSQQQSQSNQQPTPFTPSSWSKLLISTIHTIYFIHLPSYLQYQQTKTNLTDDSQSQSQPQPLQTLSSSFTLLTSLSLNRIPIDPLCYSILMQLCYTYSQPLLAVKLLFEMKRNDIMPNPVTYGWYNKVLMENSQIINEGIRSKLLWGKLRGVIRGVGGFKRGGRERQLRLERESEAKIPIDSTTPSTWSKYLHTTFDSLLKSSVETINSLSINHYQQTQSQQFMEFTQNQEIEGEEEKDQLNIKEPKKIPSAQRKLSFDNLKPSNPIVQNPNSTNSIPKVNHDSFSKLTDDGNNIESIGEKSSTTTPPSGNLELEPPINHTTFPLSPTRRVVLTKDDPLGALDKINQLNQQLAPPPKRTCSDGNITNKVLSSPHKPHIMTPFQRSSTLPNNTCNLSPHISQREHKQQEPKQQQPKSTTFSSSPSPLKSFLKSPHLISSPSSLLFHHLPQKTSTLLLEGLNSINLNNTKNVVEAAKKKIFQVIQNNSSNITSNNTKKKKNRRQQQQPNQEDDQDAQNDEDEYESSASDSASSISSTSSTSTTYSHRQSSSADQWASVSESYLEQVIQQQNAKEDDQQDQLQEEQMPPPSQHQLIFNDPFHHQSEQPRDPPTLNSHPPSSPNLLLTLTSTSLCHTCSSLLFDEEILAGWTLDESNLTTKCPHCSGMGVPFLEVVKIKLKEAKLKRQKSEDNITISHLTVDKQKERKPSLQTTINGATATAPMQSDENDSDQPIIIPYLSPFVLRKELDTCLTTNNSTTNPTPQNSSLLSSKSFPSHHPVIYWNLVWYFHRLQLQSHLQQLVLEDDDDQDGVIELHAKWDNEKFHNKFSPRPLYIQYREILKKKFDNRKESIIATNEQQQQQQQLENLLSSLISSLTLQTPSLSLICPKLLHYYHTTKEGQQNEEKAQPLRRHFPTYRDILFLHIAAVGRDKVNLNSLSFDRSYRSAYSLLRNSDEYHESMDVGDLPPGDWAIWCRNGKRSHNNNNNKSQIYWGELEI